MCKQKDSGKIDMLAQFPKLHVGNINCFETLNFLNCPLQQICTTHGYDQTLKCYLLLQPEILSFIVVSKFKFKYVGLTVITCLAHKLPAKSNICGILILCKFGAFNANKMNSAKLPLALYHLAKTPFWQLTQVTN